MCLFHSYVSFFNDQFAGQIVGTLDGASGIRFEAQLKAIDYGFLQIRGTNGLSQEQLESRRLLMAKNNPSNKSIIASSDLAVATEDAARFNSLIPASFTDEDPRLKIVAMRGAAFEAIVDCAVTLLGMTAAADITINAAGYNFLVYGNLFDIFSAEVRASMTSAIFSVSVTLRQTIIEELDKMIREVVGAIFDAIEKAWEFAVEVAERFVQAIQDLGKMVGDAAKKLAKWITDQAKVIAELFSQIANELANVIRELGDAVRAAMDKAKELWQNMKDGAQRMLDAAKRAIQNAARYLSDRLNHIAEKLKELLNLARHTHNVYEAAKSSASSALESVEWHDRKINSVEDGIRRKQEEKRRVNWFRRRWLDVQIGVLRLDCARWEIGRGGVRVLYFTKKGIQDTAWHAWQAAKSDQNNCNKDNDPEIKRFERDKASAEKQKAEAEKQLNDKFDIDKFDATLDPCVRAEQMKLDQKNREKEEKEKELELAKNKKAETEEILSKEKKDYENDLAREETKQADHLNGEYKDAITMYESDDFQDFIEWRKEQEEIVGARFIAKIFNISEIFFETKLETSEGVEVDLRVKYNFMSTNQREMRFSFRFSFGDAREQIRKFAKGIANSILGINRSRIETLEGEPELITVTDFEAFEREDELTEIYTAEFEAERLPHLVDTVDEYARFISKESEDLEIIFDRISEEENTRTNLIALELTASQSLFDTSTAQSLLDESEEKNIKPRFKSIVANSMSTLSELDNDVRLQSNMIKSTLTSIVEDISEVDNITVQSNVTSSMKEKIRKWNEVCGRANRKLGNNASIFNTDGENRRKPMYDALFANVREMRNLKEAFDDETARLRSQVQGLEESVRNGEDSLFSDLSDKRNKFSDRIDVSYSLDLALNETERILKDRMEVEKEYSEVAESEKDFFSNVLLKPIEL